MCVLNGSGMSYDPCYVDTRRRWQMCPALLTTSHYTSNAHSSCCDPVPVLHTTHPQSLCSCTSESGSLFKTVSQPVLCPDPSSCGGPGPQPKSESPALVCIFSLVFPPPLLAFPGKDELSGKAPMKQPFPSFWSAIPGQLQPGTCNLQRSSPSLEVNSSPHLLSSLSLSSHTSSSSHTPL